jgi:hypothetical protein
MEYASDGAWALPELDETDFDHTDPVVAQEIYGLLAASRERCPVLRSSRHGGFCTFGAAELENAMRAMKLGHVLKPVVVFDEGH